MADCVRPCQDTVRLEQACSAQPYCSSGNDLHSTAGPCDLYTSVEWTNTCSCIDTIKVSHGCVMEVASGAHGSGTVWGPFPHDIAVEPEGIGYDTIRSIRVYPQVTWPTGLVRLYKCDEGSGALVRDSSGSGVDATMYGAMAGSGNTWQQQSVNGMQRTVMYFDMNGYVTASASGLPGGSAARTIVAWVRPLRGGGNGPFGYGKGECNGAYYAWISGESLSLDQWCQEEGVNPVLANFEERWYHLAFTYDGDINAAYVDGRLHVQGAPDARPNTQVGGDAQVVMGGNPALSADYKGWIADFAIFNRALSEPEIASIYQLPSGHGRDGREDGTHSEPPHLGGFAPCYVLWPLAIGFGLVTCKTLENALSKTVDMAALAKVEECWGKQKCWGFIIFLVCIVFHFLCAVWLGWLWVPTFAGPCIVLGVVLPLCFCACGDKNLNARREEIKRHPPGPPEPPATPAVDPAMEPAIAAKEEAPGGGYPELQGTWLPTRHEQWTRPHQARDRRTVETWDDRGRCAYQTQGDRGEIVVTSKKVNPRTGLAEYHCKGISGGSARCPQLVRRANADGTHSWDLGANGTEHWNLVVEDNAEENLIGVPQRDPN